MGVDEGFDMVPRLSQGGPDSRKWEAFINTIKSYYVDDDQVEVRASCIVFKVGEWPALPFQGHQFLRFSSKVTGGEHEVPGVSTYIRAVTRAARKIFGARVVFWSEFADQLGFYDWRAVHEARRSYDEAPNPEVPAKMTFHEPGYRPVYEEVEIAGRGQGLVARMNIARGTRILLEKPLFTTGNMSGNMSAEHLEKAIAEKVRGLSREQQRQFLSLHNNHPGKHPFSGIYRTNALPCGSGSPIGAVYPDICRINHSCRSNSHNSWNAALDAETIHATRDIRAGEEITIDYTDGDRSSARWAKLRDSFGFQCDCVVCSLPPAELKASDVRRERMKELDEKIGDPSRMLSNPAGALADCRSLILAIEEEYPDTTHALLARAYYDAFQICAAHGDGARGRIFAERAHAVRVVEEGEDSPTTRKMKALALNPESHPTFSAFSRGPKTCRQFDPQNLSQSELDKWLWRQSK